MTGHPLPVICFALAWLCAWVAAAAAWIAMNTGRAWAAGWMAAATIGGAGLVLIGLDLW